MHTAPGAAAVAEGAALACVFADVLALAGAVTAVRAARDALVRPALARAVDA
ncbi:MULTISPECIES: hypothetical protein [unclassified Streptomyces]|uniref:hypothetical protein n=1 Tax=unclassified Streptomyces TaxID=2593676 RepID=UPI0028846B47|nr:hypothetical protein [Streptomyces sp. DSM 41633]